MAVQVNLVDENVVVDTSNDSIVIIDNQFSIPGGKSLDVTGYPEDVLNAGHIIIKDASGNYKPMPLAVLGAIQSIGTIAGGSGYTNNGTYSGVALTGGSGTGATANIVVAGNAVTTVTIVNKGTGYKAGDILSAAASNIGTGGSGFQFAVASVGGTATAYDSLPANHSYVGVLVASILTKRAMAGVMLEGWVNENAMPYPITSIKSAFLTAVNNNIKFRGDLS